MVNALVISANRTHGKVSDKQNEHHKAEHFHMRNQRTDNEGKAVGAHENQPDYKEIKGKS